MLPFGISMEPYASTMAGTACTLIHLIPIFPLVSLSLSPSVSFFHPLTIYIITAFSKLHVLTYTDEALCPVYSLDF